MVFNTILYNTGKHKRRDGEKASGCRRNIVKILTMQERSMVWAFCTMQAVNYCAILSLDFLAFACYHYIKIKVKGKPRTYFLELKRT